MNAHAPEAGLASLLASRGRNGDSVLVHMTPGELAGLHQLAFAAGGQLTVNPHTGLYEANFLKKLLPTLLGFGLNFLFPGLGAIGSSLLVGGVEAARTGDLSKGLMAGLGAYGGASLGSAVSTAGAATSTEAAKMAAANAGNVGGTAGGAAAGFVPGGVQAGMTAADAATKALAPEAFKNVATAPITGANLQSGISALRAAPGTTLQAVGSRLTAPAVAGLGSTAANLMTPDMKPYDPEDPTFYISGGYDPYTGFKPGYYSQTYQPYGTPRGMAMGGIIPRQNPSYPMGAMQMGARSYLDTNAPREVVGGYDALINPMDGQERPQVNFAEGGETKKPASAANVQYQGTDAEKLRQYMQALNESFIPAPTPPPAAPPPAGIAPPGAGGRYTAGTGDNYNNPYGIDFGELRNFGVNINPSMLADATRGAQTIGYSKPLYMMTAQEKAAEDAARASAAPVDVKTDVTKYTPPPGYMPFDLSGIQKYAEDYFTSKLNPFSEKLAGIESRIGQIPTEQAPVPEFDYSKIPSYTPPDLSGIQERLAAIEKRPVPEFDYSRIPSYTPPDLSGIQERLAAIEKRPAPEFDYSRIPTYTPPDLSGIEARISSLQSGLGSLQNRPAPEFDYSRIPTYTPPDLSGLYERLGGLESKISNLPAPVVNAPQVNFDPVLERIAALESRIGSTAPASTAQGIGSFDQNFDQFGNEYNFAFAKGGVARRGRKKRKQTPVAGKLVNGKGDGMSDSIRANINGDQEARLTDGEFVIPADVVSHLGNGSTDAGSKKLYDMMARVRKARTGRAHQAPQVNVDGMMPR